MVMPTFAVANLKVTPAELQLYGNVRLASLKTAMPFTVFATKLVPAPVTKPFAEFTEPKEQNPGTFAVMPTLWRAAFIS